MSARLLTVTPELAALADGCQEEARDRRAVPAGVAGDPRPAQRDRRRDPGPATAAPARPGLAAVRHAGRTAGRSRHHRCVAAYARQRAAGRRSAGLVAGRRARLRFSFVRPGYAAKLRRARRGGRRAAGVGRGAPGLQLAARRRAGRAAGGRTQHPPSAGRRPRAIVRPGPQRTGRRRGRRPRGRELRSRRGAQLRHLDVPVGVGRLGGRDPAERGWPAGRLRAGTLLSGRHLAAVRDDRRSAQRGGDSARDAGTSALPGDGGGPRTTARK